MYDMHNNSPSVFAQSDTTKIIHEISENKRKQISSDFLNKTVLF